MLLNHSISLHGLYRFSKSHSHFEPPRFDHCSVLVAQVSFLWNQGKPHGGFLAAEGDTWCPSAKLECLWRQTLLLIGDTLYPFLRTDVPSYWHNRWIAPHVKSQVGWIFICALFAAQQLLTSRLPNCGDHIFFPLLLAKVCLVSWNLWTLPQRLVPCNQSWGPQAISSVSMSNWFNQALHLAPQIFFDATFKSHKLPCVKFFVAVPFFIISGVTVLLKLLYSTSILDVKRSQCICFDPLY